MIKTDDIIEGLDWVNDLIGALCKEGRCPAMSIPARPNHDEDLLAARKLKDAIAHLKAMQWVPIADIPEEWKDGRPVWLFFINTAVTGPLSLEERFRGEYARILKSFPEYCCWQKASWSKHNGGGWIWEGMSGTPFFVMPPIAPPALGKTEE